ncbi:PBP1A family penicillin-binding protein [Paenibacillus massiliensis]|uniref:PBP1A family penicillin-binding protein n=1 Tax=Paenibacillus massiliensis TaxID=225917 RepID=UPI000472754B|nr:PBP1A family penicillin-binding protein [Paenibacillus massiliensis]
MSNDSLSRSGNRNRPRTPANPKPKAKKKKITGKRVMWTLFFTTAFAVFCALAGYLFLTVNGEKLYQANLDKVTVNPPTEIYDRNGKLMTELSYEKSDPVEGDEIPQLLKDAFVATEDKRFYEHQGVDIWAIGRAAVRDVVARAAVEGGSTITQQLAKNLFLTRDKTFFRKATEVSIAMALERDMEKDQILTLYLNRIFFGHQRVGIKAASEYYFGKSDLNQLELWEMATLAAMPKGPSKYNPLSNPQESKDRRAVVLTLMQEQGYITKEQMDEAKAVDYAYEPPAREQKYQPFIEYALDEAEDVTGLTRDDLTVGGYKIYTTMDAQAQTALEKAFKDDDLFEKSRDEQPVQGSMVIMNNQNGSLAAILGGRDYQRGNLNRATSVRRQPGSALKPIVSYAPALETGKFNSNSLLNNEKQCFGNYCPKNLHGYSPTVGMKEAITKSENIPAVWLLNEIGVNTGYTFAQKLGIQMGENDKTLAIALGGMEKGTNTLEMAQAYSAFANKGKYQPAYAIKEIRDSSDSVRYKHESSLTEVMSPATAYYMTEMMQDVVNTGTGRRAKIDWPVAGKTGTTQSGISGNSGNRDVWFVGYTPEYTGAVWMGYDQPDRNHMLKNSSGLTAQFFGRVMSEALKGHPVTSFEKPDGLEPPEPVVEEPLVSPVSGLAADYRPETQIVNLSWNSSETEQVQYRVYRKAETESDFRGIIEGLSVTNTEDIDVPEGMTFDYYVVAYDAQGNESDPSNTVRVQITAAEPPAQEQPGDLEPDPENPIPGDGTQPGNPEWPGVPEDPNNGDGTGVEQPGGTNGNDPVTPGSDSEVPSDQQEIPPVDPGSTNPSNEPVQGTPDATINPGLENSGNHGNGNGNGRSNGNGNQANGFGG